MERAFGFGKGKELAMPSARPPPKRCPRCDSTNTKFCYFNNYSQSQPRHFCRACRRYWTEGGTLRNVPQGGGSHHRKAKRSRKSSATGSSSSSDTFNPVNSTGLDAPVVPTTTAPPPPLPPVYLGEGMMALFQPFTPTVPGPMMTFKQAQFSQPIQLPAGFVNIPLQAQMPPPPPPQQFDPIMALPSRFGLREYHQPMNSSDMSQFTTVSVGTTASSSGLNAAGGSGTDQDGFYWNINSGINDQGDGGSCSPRRPPMP